MYLSIQKINFLILILLFIGNKSISQEKKSSEQDNALTMLDSLWANPTSFFNRNDENWRMLCENLDQVDLTRLNNISQSIFYGVDAKILNQNEASVGTLGSFSKKANKKKRKEFSKRIRNGFRNYKEYPGHKVVLMEGDYWFEYPIFLEDITDNLMDSENLAIYSMASGRRLGF